MGEGPPPLFASWREKRRRKHWTPAAIDPRLLATYFLSVLVFFAVLALFLFALLTNKSFAATVGLASGAIIALFVLPTVAHFLPVFATRLPYRIGLILSLSMAAIWLVAVVAVQPDDRGAFTLAGITTVSTVYGGALAVSRVREGTLTRLAAAQRVPLTAGGRIQLSRSALETRSIAFYGLPLGLIVGLAVSALLALSSIQATKLVVEITILATATLLAGEIARNAAYMMDPLFDAEDDAKSAPLHPLSRRRWQIFIAATSQAPSPAPPDRLAVDIACAAADIRQTFFWSSMYAVTVLAGLLGTAAVLMRYRPQNAWLVAGSLFALLLLVQAPYAIGQSTLHSRLLVGREGEDRSALRTTLETHAPILPRLPLVTALTTTGTAGGILYFVMTKLIEGLFTGK